MSKGQWPNRNNRGRDADIGEFSCMKCLANGNEFKTYNAVVMKAHAAGCDGGGRI